MTQIRSIALLCLFLCTIAGGQSAIAQSHDLTTFILVRHAEKADDGTDDPPLNATGQERAAALADHLNETNVTAIYSTDYKRTLQTVQAIADAKGLEIKRYDPFKEQLLQHIMAENTGGTVLISGHSNTTPLLLNKLIGKDQYEQFDDADYDNLFIVTATAVGKGKALKLTF